MKMAVANQARRSEGAVRSPSRRLVKSRIGIRINEGKSPK